MALAPIERFAGPSIYQRLDRIPTDRIPTDRSAAAVAPVETTVSAPRAVAPAEPRQVSPVDQRPTTEPAGLGNLAASARAATVALAAVPRDADPADGAAAAADAEDAALAALADPLNPPSPREVAQNFAAIAALVPSPQEIANNVVSADDGVSRIDALAAVRAANDDGAQVGRGGVLDYPGARLSRFA